MLKHLLIIGAATISVPAIAQETPPADPAAPPPTEQADPSASQPTPAPEAAPPAGDVAPQSAPPGTAATATQVGQIVDREFASYDADKSNDLNQSEFAAWMKKLRTATDPTVDPESEQIKTWVGQAWAAADADKSGSVNKDELTGFLSRGA